MFMENVPIFFALLISRKIVQSFYHLFFFHRAEKEYHLCDRYIPYALGGGYVLSQVSFMEFLLL